MRLGTRLLTILLSTFYLSCENGTEPTKPVVGEYPRNLVWTADTIETPGGFRTAMYDIWASSHTDVYIVGHNLELTGKMWHFNGESWSSIPLHISEGGPVTQNFMIMDIYGFSSNEIYAVGFSDKSNGKISIHMENVESLILKYDGVAWTREEIQLDDIAIHSVWGSDPNNVWFGGENGLVINHLNSTWTIDTLTNPGEPVVDPPFIKCLSGSSTQNRVLGMIIWPNTQLFRFEQNQWTPANYIEEMTYDIWTSPSGKHYLGLHHSWQSWDGNSDPVIIHDLGVRAMYGLNDNDIFFVGIDVNDGGIWKLYHYNGSDVKEITAIADEDTYVKDCWTNGEEVFAVANSYRTAATKTVIYHGK